MSETNDLGYTFANKTVKIGGRDWTFRELSVEENDDCNDSGNGPDGKWNGRAAMRAMILHSCVDPKLSAAQLAKLPLSIYNKIIEAVNDVNSGDFEQDEADPNA